MKRLHAHMGVDDLAASVRFYTAQFAAEPTGRKPDYAEWMLENPRVNFAIPHVRGPSGCCTPPSLLPASESACGCGAQAAE